MPTGDMPIVDNGDIARFGLSESMLCNDWMLPPLLTELLISSTLLGLKLLDSTLLGLTLLG